MVETAAMPWALAEEGLDLGVWTFWTFPYKSVTHLPNSGIKFGLCEYFLIVRCGCPCSFVLTA